MLAASPLPPILSNAGATAAPTISPALSQTSAASAITYFATPPAIASNSLLNQRQANALISGGNGSVVPPALGNAVVSSAGLQPAPLRPLVQEFGYSSAFMTQLIDQSSSGNLSSILRTPNYRNVASDAGSMADVRYMPSAAGTPIIIPPMLELAKRPVTLRQQETAAPSAIDAMRSMPTRSAAELMTQQQSIQLNISTLAQGSAPAMFTRVAQAVPVQQEVIPAAVKTTESSASATAEDAPSPRTRQAISAYTQAASRMGAYTAPETVANQDSATVEAISAVV